MIITLYGENIYELKQARDALLAEAAAQHGGHAITQLESAEATVDQLREALLANSLFASSTALLLKEPSKNKMLAEGLIELLPQVPEENTLIIVEYSLDKRTVFYKTLKKLSDFREFPTHDSGYLRKWLVSEATARGGKMNTNVATSLIDAVGVDQWQLSNELDKLIAYKKEITIDDVELLVEPNLEASAFALLDAVMAGKEVETRQLLFMLRQKSDPYEFFGLLAWQIHAVALVAFAPKQLTQAQLAKQSGLKPFVIQKAQSIVRRIGQDGIKQAVDHIAQLDIRLKSSGVEPWLLVEQALYKIAAK